MSDSSVLLIYGASNVCRLRKFLPDNVICESHPGWTSEQLARNSVDGIPALLERYPSIQAVVVSAGTNDVGSLLMHESIRYIEQMLNGSKRAIALETPNLERLNRAIRRNNNNNTIAFSRLLESDGIHLSEDGALEVSQRILDWFFCLS